MDLSKLPRLSQSDAPPPQSGAPADPSAPVNYEAAERPPQAAPPGTPRLNYEDRPAAGTGAEIWISLAIGLILMFWAARFGTYLISLITHEAFHTGVPWIAGPKAGQEVAYWELEGFTAWTEASLWLFGLTLVFDALILYAAGGKRAWLVVVGFALTLGVCAFNAFVCAKIFNAGVTPLMSLMALAFGIYMAIYQWGLLKDVLAAQGLARGLARDQIIG
jgi:hypothetical protein